MTNREKKPCPHCGVEIEACPPPCLEWDCAFHTHLYKNCPSEEGKQYREMVAKKKARRLEKLTEWGAQFVENVTRVKARYVLKDPSNSFIHAEADDEGTVVHVDAGNYNQPTVKWDKTGTHLGVFPGQVTVIHPGS